MNEAAKLPVPVEDDPGFRVTNTQVVIGNVIVDHRFCRNDVQHDYLASQLTKGRMTAGQAQDKLFHWMVAERILRPNMAPGTLKWPPEGRDQD